MRIRVQLLRIVLAGAGLVCCGAWANERAERITLGSGTTALRGEIKGYDSVQYSFTARPGQQLAIRLVTSNPSNYINVERNGLGEAVCQGALTGNVCSVHSESVADYVVDVFLMRNAARRGEKAEYTLFIDQGAAPTEQPVAQPVDAAKEAASAAVAACKSALALKSGANAVFVLPVSHVPAAGGYEVFLSLRGAQWLCTTDPRGNVNRLEQR